MPQKDPRHYARIAVDWPMNRKLAGAHPNTKLLDVVAVCFAAQNLTDGEITPGIVCALAGVPAKHGIDLVNRDRWHRKGHACPDCPQPTVEGDVVIHHYLLHQDAAEKVQRRRAEKVLAGKLGNHDRWKHSEPFERCPICND
jgi:hypothetical protein